MSKRSACGAARSRHGLSGRACLLAVTILLAGCSTGNDGSSKIGAESASPPGRTAGPAPRPTTSYDSDGPTYRGGRDPVTGRAEQSWPPAAPPTVQSAPMTALPPSAPAHASAPPPSYPQQAHPQQASSPGVAPQPAGGAVEVRPGDTLYRIARAYNVTVPALMQANGLTSESIKVGQRLTIPGR